jgi:hypothetical protein
MGVILVIAVLFGASWLYYSVKKQAKRKLFFSGQYERQKSLTHRNLILTTTASIDAVQWSLAHHLPDDRSARAAFLGGAMRVRMENPNRIVYHHTSHVVAGGKSDEFTGSVTLRQIDASRLRAVVSIDRWREKDGVTRRTGISAMENFMNTVVGAFRAVDPTVHVGT